METIRVYRTSPWQQIANISRNFCLCIHFFTEVRSHELIWQWLFRSVTTLDNKQCTKHHGKWEWVFKWPGSPWGLVAQWIEPPPVFRRLWIRFLSGTQILSLSHACVMWISSLFTQSFMFDKLLQRLLPFLPYTVYILDFSSEHGSAFSQVVLPYSDNRRGTCLGWS